MKKWINTMFFGCCFITAILIEAYGVILFEGDLLSVIALGIVVLITGYLFMDSIKSKLEEKSDNTKFYMDKFMSEESEKWSERHNEIINLQKASYTATKKNSAMLTDQYAEVLLRLETLENNNAKTLEKVIELQKLSLEGQKNALNLEINYNKENTKRIIGSLKEETQKNDIKEQLIRIMEAIEDNNNQILKQLNQSRKESPSIEENASEIDVSAADASVPEAMIQPDEEITEKKVVPLYDDPYKNLSTDEIAAMFATYGN